ncbi:MAG: YggS family pyridoxal phosphate-dependent enzyme [Devosia sp.]|uniref:YggS family pyridoxal phosphate-dependent enzyme n=1 Tax=Devosia sp. 66-22 TaxID=1895753 RepID=UPI000A8437AD|nr:YggS family pyridoxal phosphate-dependent enzyme [Devosia sp. 66-22]MBN9346104.1 YggS family pyridoxal phosphate-dependent enzyme [Devosia sp.]
MAIDNAAERLDIIRSRIERARRRFGPPPARVELVAVSKTFAADDVRPFLDAGQRVFGENRVQEAAAKWPGLRGSYDGIELHLIGPLQSNKAKEAVALFDVIETVDREKIAVALKAEMDRMGKRPRLLVQVNIGLEPQKAGIAPAEAVAFVARCRDVHGLAIEGVMAIPPEGVPSGPYFAHMAELAAAAGATTLSMGMSADFETAIAMGATHVRVGSALFGHRSAP